MKLLSYVDILIKKEDKIKALNLILKNSLRYNTIKFVDKGDILIRVYSWRKKSYERIFSENKINYSFSKQYGLLSFVSKNRHRVGILVGFFILIFALWYSQNIIWRIDIKGNHKVEREEIITALEKEGIYLGRYIPSINYDTTHNRFLMNNKDFSWISVNINGNIACVNVREAEFPRVEGNVNKYANIVANQDGQIALISVKEGEKQISIGDSVKKGDLLISGIIDSKSEGVRLTCAKGEVYAFVNKEIFVKIPLKSEEKTYTGKVYTEKTVYFYKKYIKLFKKHSNYDRFYDTIEETRQISLFGKIPLPIKVKQVRYYEYEIIDIQHTKEQGIDKAFVELRSKLDISLKNAELLSKEIKIDYDEENVYLECDIYCLENIAEERQFYID